LPAAGDIRDRVDSTMCVGCNIESCFMRQSVQHPAKHPKLRILRSLAITV